MKLLPESRQARLAIGILAVIVGMNVIAIAVDALVPSPEGPRSSSFATSSPGMAAWKELAERSGRDVTVVRERLSDASLPPKGTAVILDPEEFTRSEARTLRRFAEDGGRVVTGGLSPGAWIDEFGARLDWARLGREDARVLAPAAETGAARRLRTAGEGHWADVSGAQPIVADADGRSLVVVRELGQGRVVLVADPSPLQNRLLDEADNAALALALAGRRPTGVPGGTARLRRGDRACRAAGSLPVGADHSGPGRAAADRGALAATRPARPGPDAAVPAAPRVRRRAGGHPGQDARAQRRASSPYAPPHASGWRAAPRSGATRTPRPGTRRPVRPGSAMKRQGHCRT